MTDIVSKLDLVLRKLHTPILTYTVAVKTYDLVFRLFLDCLLKSP